MAEWTGIKLSANQLRALGELKLRDLDKTAQLEGNLSLAQFNLREFLDGIGIVLPAMRDNTTLSRFEMSTRLAGTPTSINANSKVNLWNKTAFPISTDPDRHGRRGGAESALHPTGRPATAFR